MAQENALLADRPFLKDDWKWAGTPGPWLRKTGERFKHDQSAGVKAGRTYPDGTKSGLVYVAAALDANRTDMDAEVEANATALAGVPDAIAALRGLLRSATPLTIQPGGTMWAVDGETLVVALQALQRMVEG